MSVAVLIDTNVIIKREDPKVIDVDVQKLMNTLNGLDFQMYIHENSFKDIDNDKNEKRKEIIKSKMNCYSILKTEFDFTKDAKFLELMNYDGNSHDYVDISLLYSLLKNEVSFLITEDIGIHKKANRINNEYSNFNDRVFTIQEALSFFKEKTPSLPYFIKKTTVNLLDIDDPIFDKLKRDYVGFDNWFRKVQRQRRDCLCYINSNECLGALLIYKSENEIIDVGDFKLPAIDRIKIATMVVTNNGYKIGELFLSWIINYALRNNTEELYLTHYRDGEDDPLIYLIEEYGFECVGSRSDGELVYVKLINRDEVQIKIDECGENCDYATLSKRFYPYFYEGENVNKYVVPIKERFHKKLFLSKDQQTSLSSFFGDKEDAIEIQKNTIKKAYLSKSNANLKPGDIVLFYETPNKGISEIGVVEEFHKNLSYEEIISIVGKRSVYSSNELKSFEGKNSVMLFIFSKKINKITKKELIKSNIIKSHPQSTQRIDEEKYIEFKKLMKE